MAILPGQTANSTAESEKVLNWRTLLLLNSSSALWLTDRNRGLTLFDLANILSRHVFGKYYDPIYQTSTEDSPQRLH